MRYVMVGFSWGILPALNRLLPENSVVILEDPYIIDGRGVPEKMAAFPCAERLIRAPLQSEDAIADIVELADSAGDVDAVITGHEYGVLPAAAVAAHRGLPGAGVEAATRLRDKAALRRAAGEAGIAQPEWTEVRDVDDVLAFPHRPVVIKPGNRQASVGVELTDAGDTDEVVAAAFRRSKAAEEPTMASPDGTPPRHLVERRLFGPELSVEALVDRGRMIFSNQTTKIVAPGPHPVELGHTLPAPRSAAVDSAMRKLIDAVGFSTGVLHAEWILVDGTPHLVECAGRLPGDDIVPLIDFAYGGSLVKDLVALLSGTAVDRSDTARRGAAVRFLSAAPGRVQRVDGVEAATKVRGVLDVNVTAAPGDLVRPVSSSWDRLGRILAIGRDHAGAAAAADRAAAQVMITTD